MGKVALIAAAWFVLAMVLPELRPLLLVAAFSAFGGFVVGTQHTAKHTAELRANRAERASMRQVEA